jgi:hypothetical protein
MKVFAQIQKVDEAKRLVFGRAAEEIVDKADEIMDYATSKPHFQKWSADVAADTDGKSLGNLRAMHGKVAAGKLTGIEFNDGAKAIDVCAKVVDDNEWKKVLEGVYTGFSIGGSYAGSSVEKMDGKDIKRYTAIPTEISLVDRPCMPTAKFFEVQKADGTLAKVEFHPAEDDETIEGTPEDVTALIKAMKAGNLDLKKVIEKIQADPVEKVVEKFIVVKAEDCELDADGKPKLGKDGKPIPKAVPSEPDGDEAEKAAKAAALAKAEADKLATTQAPEALTKLLADALGPLEKRLGEQDTLIKAQASEIEKLKAQPAAPTVRLRAVAKGNDIPNPDAAAEAEAALAKASAPIVDDIGDKHEAAGLIKALHKYTGQPMTLPVHALNK